MAFGRHPQDAGLFYATTLKTVAYRLHHFNQCQRTKKPKQCLNKALFGFLK